MDVRADLRGVAVCAATVLVLAACAGGDAPDDAGAEAPDETASPTELAEPISEARALVAAEAQVSADQVEMVSAESVTWRSGALGCPQPDQIYTQALVEGYRIVLEAGGERYHAHGATGEAPFLCEDPESPADTGSTDGY